MPMNKVKKTISGWGLFPSTQSFLVRPERIKEACEVDVSHIARGYGRCYGDAAQLTEGHVVLTERLNRILAFDAEKGIVRAEAGVSFNDLLNIFVPKGWFPPVTPGTKWVSIGGCVAADVHGKNHHVDGSLGKYILALELILPGGNRMRCSPSQEPELFWATVGGMGLTGIISEVTLQLIPINTAYMVVKNTSASCLEVLFEKLLDPSLEDRYSVAWVDCMASGQEFGRGIIMNGHHAELKDLEPRQHPFCIKKARAHSVPLSFSSLLLSPRTIRKFNQFYYAYLGKFARSEIVDYDRYFYPLDVIANWNRIYGKKGFVQYQFVTPIKQSRDVCHRILSMLAGANFNPYLAVLKRFGEQGEGYLSFPKEGFTLALDIPIRNDSLFPLLDKLDQIIIENQGRVYLAKDARMSASTFKHMYPRLEEWMKVKQKVDPLGKATSDLAKRLHV